MLDLNSLLGRVRKTLGRNVVQKEIVQRAIESETGISLKPEEINIKEFTLEISTSPLKKSEIKLHEVEILAQVRANTNQNINKVFYK